MSINVQQDATIHTLSVNCSTCFGWFLHSSSGAQITVSTASSTSQPLLLPGRNHRKHVEHFHIKQTLHSCILLDIYWHRIAMHGPMNVKPKKELLCYWYYMSCQKKIKYLTRELGEKTKIKSAISEVLAALTNIQVVWTVRPSRRENCYRGA